MEQRYFKWYSQRLGREMECKQYGHAGRPVLFIPCQDGRFFDFENFRMIDTWAPWIERGAVMVFSVDTVDRETWSDPGGEPRGRIARYEQWLEYLVREVVPLIRTVAWERTGQEDAGILAFGCSLGALHAANLYFRWPDCFTGLLALSGIYDAGYGFPGYMDEAVYRCSPVHYLGGMPHDHALLAQYRRNRGVVCVGQGAWEQPETTFRLRDIFQAKGIPVRVDVWGTDVCHDWDWWFRQTACFLPGLLGEG